MIEFLRIVVKCDKNLKEFFNDDESEMVIPNASHESVRDVLKLIYRQSIEVDGAREAEVDIVIKKFKLNASKSYESPEESSFEESDASIQEASLDLQSSLPPLDLPQPPLDLSLLASDHSESEWDLSDLASHMASVYSNVNSTLIVRPSVRPIATKTATNTAKKTIARRKKRRVSRVRRVIRRRESYFRKRQSRHYNGAHYTCRYCPMCVTFQFKRGRYNHELTCAFNPKSSDYFGCDKCDRRYLFKGTLKLHMKRKHQQDPEA